MAKFLFRPRTNTDRRVFLKSLGVGLMGSLAMPHALGARPARTQRSNRIIVGSGKHTYEWVKDWAKLPSGMQLGSCHGGIVIDSQGRIFLNTETENAVMVFDSDGRFIKSWGREFKSGCHGMMIRKEGRSEFLYLTHTARHELIKVTPNGEVVWTRGYPEQAGIYRAASEYKPTAVAFAPNGDIYVTDGYGKFFVHHYNADGEYLRSWGGAGSEPGKLNNPHGIWVDTRRRTPVVVVADRGNKRLQMFTPDGRHAGFVTDQMRLPSNMDQRNEDLAVVDLAGKVTILDRENNVVAHLGDNPDSNKRATNRIPPNEWVDGIFISPHSARWDRRGNLYVHEWLTQGRVIKLRRL